jgi:hypothetical protein
LSLPEDPQIQDPSLKIHIALTPTQAEEDCQRPKCKGSHHRHADKTTQTLTSLVREPGRNLHENHRHSRNQHRRDEVAQRTIIHQVGAITSTKPC